VLFVLLAALPPLFDYLAGMRPKLEDEVVRGPRPSGKAARKSFHQPQGCRVAHVVDGDTVDFRCRGAGIIRARLTGFDAPELYSPQCLSEAARAVAAQNWLRWKLARADRLKVVMGGQDRYDRRLAEVFVDGRRMADLMIAAGHARPYSGGRREGWC
jgi:micrococcal nuclease